MASWPMIDLAYTLLFKCHRRLKLKKCVLICCFVGITASLFLLVDKLSDLKNSQIKFKSKQPFDDDFEEKPILEEILTVGNSPSVLSVEVKKLNLETIRNIDGLNTLSSAEDVKKPTVSQEDDELIDEIDGQATDSTDQIEVNQIKIGNTNSDATRKIYTYSMKSAKHVVIPNSGLSDDPGTIDNKQKHLLILGHYEQLGKTTVNYFEAAKFAYLTDRKIVKPYARNSRFCGLVSGWKGELRKNTRAFFPLDLYYNISALEKLFSAHKLGKMEYLETFKKSCSFDNDRRRILVIYVFFGPRNYNQKVHRITDSEQTNIEKLLNQSTGWIDCSFINQRIKLDERIGGNVRVGQQYCVDSNKVVDIDLFENKVLQNNPCVVLHQWRGAGDQRMHFNLNNTALHENLLKQIVPSDFVLSEVLRFTKMLGSKFIGVHIRSERQLLWNGQKKFSKCMDLVYREVRKLKHATKIDRIFVSADIGPFGSDRIEPNLSASDMELVKEKYVWLVNKLNATTFSAIKAKHHVWTDTGLVAFIQLHILSKATHLVTLGSGTFQKWITNKFKDRNLRAHIKSWTITRACFSEFKPSKLNDLPSGKRKHSN